MGIMQTYGKENKGEEMIKLIWNEEEGEGGVVIDKEFVTAPRIVQLDALVDWMTELKEIYESMLEQP
jgi:hypothetical protein